MGNCNPSAYTSPQAPMPPAVPSFGAAQHWEIGDVVGHAWRMFKPAWPTLVFTQLLTSILGGIPHYIPGIAVAAGAVEHGSSSYWTLYAIGVVVGLLFSTFFSCGMIKIWCAAARGQTPQFGDMFTGAARFLPMLGGTFLVLLAVLLGYVLLVLPGILLVLGLSFTTFFIADKNMGPIDAMKASWEATKGQKGKIFLFGLLAGLMGFAGYLACCVGIFVAIPLIMVAWATIYTRLTGTSCGGSMWPPPSAFGYGRAPGPYGAWGPGGFGPPGGGYNGPPGSGYGPPGYGPPPPAGGFGGE